MSISPFLSFNTLKNHNGQVKISKYYENTQWNYGVRWKVMECADLLRSALGKEAKRINSASSLRRWEMYEALSNIGGANNVCTKGTLAVWPAQNERRQTWVFERGTWCLPRLLHTTIMHVWVVQKPHIEASTSTQPSLICSTTFLSLTSKLISWLPPPQTSQ